MAEQRASASATRFTSRSATFIGTLTLTARIVERLGAFGQIALIASVYGSGFISDRYFVASIGPLVIGAVAGEALSANILPALVRRTREARLVSAALWLSAGALLVVTAVYLLVAWLVVREASPAGSTRVGVWWMFAPVATLLALSGLLSGVLTYFEKYVWPPFRTAIATVAGFVLTAIVVQFTHDLVWVAAAIVGGYALSFAALVLEVRRVVGVASITLPPRDAIVEILPMGRGLGAPVAGGLLGGQVFVLLERTFAASIGVGAVSTLSYARGLVFTPLIVSQSIALGVYPGMLRAYEARELGNVRTAFERGLRLTLFLGLAGGFLFVLFGKETVHVLLQRGAFDPRDTSDAGTVLAVFTPALIGSMSMVFIARLFYAVDYFRAVVWTQAVALVVYVVIALPLRALWETSGLALAFGLAELTGATYGIVIGGRRIELGWRHLAAAVLVPACARAAIVICAVVVARLAVDLASVETDIARLAIAVVVDAAAIAAVLWFSAWPEVGPLKRRARSVVARARP
jgi:putative peptidoglycan lipid II flippase